LVSAYTIASDGTLTSVPGSPFAVGKEPEDFAITPDGKYLYVTDAESNNVSAFSIASNGSLSAVEGSPFAAGRTPVGVAVTPDGRYLYVSDYGFNETPPAISAFSISSEGGLSPVSGSPFAIGYSPYGFAISADRLAISPDGRRLYTTSNQTGNPVSALSITAEGALTAVPGSPFASGGFHPSSVAVSPDGRYVYVSNFGTYYEPRESSLSALSIASDGSLNGIPGSPFLAGGEGPSELVVSPDEGPVAAFSPTPAPASDPSSFDATASSDPDYPLASYRWEFGDGDTETTSSATTTHTYAAAGTYTATLTVTDEAGCSMTQVFTGQTVSCNGSSQAQISQQVTVPPGVRLGVARTGSGLGTVTSAPSGVECGRMCSYAFGEGEKVKLTQSPEPGSTFSGWSGACSGSEAMCEVTMSKAREVKAAFNALPTFLLSVERAGTGVGTVTSEPSGIECEATCSHTFWEGEKVELNEKPQAGSTFAGWSGGGCSGTGACQVTTNADTNVTATFSEVPSSALPPIQTLAPSPLIPPETPVPPPLPPVVAHARESAGRWREGNEFAHISRAHTPTGTKFSFSLNEQATVSFSFTQILSQGARGCLAKTHKNVKRNSCDNTVTRGTLSFTGHSGTNIVVFAGRISRTDKLKPGRYKLVITATNTAGQRSAPVSLSFTIAR
jgi:DNA-binding beta-propeller fold protein YncE